MTHASGRTRRIATLVATAGMLLGASATADVTVVYILHHEFSIHPPGGPIEDPVIRVGDTIRWVWTDSLHTTQSVVGIPEQWDSGGPHPIGHTFEHTFTHVGVWHYYCLFHGFDLGNGTAGGMAGIVTVEPAACYPDCDTSTGLGVLDIFDFLCFGNEFANGTAYACDCDTSTGPGICDIFDFLCFGNAFNAGCP